jgi:hypothetical protein
MNNKHKVKDIILDKIKHGEVAMRPRWYFVLKSILVVSGIIIGAIGLVYTLSFILFFLRQSGLFFVPLIGFRGLATFIISSPWLLILVACVFLVALELLVRQYSFGYRTPLLYMLFGIISISFLGTYGIAKTTMHDRLQAFSENTNVPIFSPLYKEYGKRELPNIHMGTIVEITDDGFILETIRNEQLHVHVSEQTRFPRNITFTEKQFVGVFGERTGDTIVAEGVRPLRDDMWRHIKPGHESTNTQTKPEVRGIRRGMK